MNRGTEKLQVCRRELSDLRRRITVLEERLARRERALSAIVADEAARDELPHVVRIAEKGLR